MLPLKPSPKTPDLRERTQKSRSSSILYVPFRKPHHHLIVKERLCCQDSAATAAAPGHSCHQSLVTYPHLSVNQYLHKFLHSACRSARQSVFAKNRRNLYLYVIR